MKKIKWLLLFWILTLLWIGSSFWYIYTNYQFEFKSNNNNNILFNINPWNSNISSYLMTYQDINWDRNSSQILYRSSSSTSNLFNIWYYSLSSYSPSYSYNTAKIYSSSSCLDLIVTWSSKQLLFHLFWNNNCNSTSNWTIWNREVYINVWDSCINSWVINTSSCDYWFYKYFGFNWTFDSRFNSLIQDNQYSWSNAWKTSISFPFPDSYSFFNSIAWSWTWPYELPSVYIINQKYIYHTWDSFSALIWLYISRINDLNSIFENSNFQVIVLDLHWSWSLSDLYFTYWIFDCPYSAQDILDCSFNDWWTISNLYTSNSITWNVLQFLTTRDWFSAGSTYNYFSNFLRNKLSTDWTLTFYRFLSPNNANTSSTAPNRISISVQLVSDWNNYFQDLFPWWNWNQSVEPIFDYNTYVINDLIVCYITSWEICSYNTFNRSSFESTFDVSDSVWNWTTWFLLWWNAYLFLKEFCLNSSFIDYAFCSQLDIYSGSAIFIDYSDWLLSYEILWDSVIVSIWWLGSWQLWDVSCWWWWCSNINTWLPNFIHSSDVDYYTWDFIDTWYFEDFYNLNITWYFMRCPFSYNSNRIVIWKKIMDYLWDRDPFVFVNCMIAWFNKWKSFNFLDRLDFPWPLMSLGSDYNVLWFDTDKNKRLLFWFFDLLLSLWLLLLIRVFYRLFS